MTFSMIKNVLSRGSLIIGALALVGSMGCAAEDELATSDTDGTEAVASTTSELSREEICYAPWVDDYHAQEWKIYGQGQWVNSYDWYAQYDSYNNQYVKWGQQSYGPDLWFYGGNMFNMKYERYGGGDVHYGDKVAIRVGNYGYLYYVPQQNGYGYDIRYSNQPKYEWEIHGGQYGWKVPTNYNVSIYNQYRHDEMVYCQRNYGIDLSWGSECHDTGNYGRYFHGAYCQ